jgi:uncharacterized protein (TIGR02270 family)
MESPEFARLAGEAFTTITGVDLARADLTQDPPTERAADVPLEEVLDLVYESNLPWPSPERVQRWWETNGGGLSPGTRYLAGKPIGPQTTPELLLKAKQRQRAAAALELGLQRPEQMLFEVRSRADRQRRQLRPSTS